MTSSRPYLIRAMYEWIVDNGFTPHILVDAGMDGVQVPPVQVSDGKIVLNLSPSAVRDLDLGNAQITFSTRFGGTPFQVRVPAAATLAIYARENGKGMVFPEPEEASKSSDEAPKQGEKKSHLTIIK